MATITLQLQISQTVATLDAPTIAAIIAWVQANIKNNLPASATITVLSYQIIP